MNIFSDLKTFPKLLIFIAITVIVPLITLLVVGPNISKPAYAAWTITDPPTWSGDNVTFRWDPQANTALSLDIVDWDDPNHTAVWDSGTDYGSIDGRTNLTVNKNSFHVGQGVTIDGQFAVTLVAYGVSLQSNRVIFTIPVVGGWSLTAGPPTGGQVLFTCGGCPSNSVEIFVVGTADHSGAMGGTTTWTWNYGSATGTYTANLVAYGYQVVATTTVTINGPNPTPTPTPQPTPTPTPTGNCNTTPGTSWSLDPAAVSGYSVKFTFNPPADGNVAILVVDSGGKLVKDSTPIGTAASSTNTWTWDATGTPNGTYCAFVTFGGPAVSNIVSFTIPSGGTGTGDTCSSLTGPNLFHIGNNKVFCHYISAGNFDSFPFTFGQLQGTLNALSMDIVGRDLNDPNTDTAAALANTSLLASSGQMVASLYSAPPVSGVQYFAQKIHDLNPVTPAYAAAGGIGYQTLGPVQKIWLAFRNIAYVGFILVFVVMGFMIMFRAHISPQAVATVQDSIPRLVIALILVTFSYAIAGFMIDIMFLTLNIAIQALVSAKLITGADYLFQKSVFGVIWGSWKDTFSVVYKALSSVISDSISLPWGLDSIIGPVLGSVGGAIGSLIVAFALIFIMFRIFFMLLMAYVMIILLTMFAPFFFLIQALPGNNGAKEWFRQMASNVAVFPAVALMFLFAGILGGIGNLAPGASAAIQPDKIGQFPLIIGNLNAQAIGQLIGIGFLLMTPAAAELVKNAMGGKGQGGTFGGAVPAMAALGASAGFLGNRVTQSSPAQAISDVFEERARTQRMQMINAIPARFRAQPGGGVRPANEVQRTRIAKQ